MKTFVTQFFRVMRRSARCGWVAILLVAMRPVICRAQGVVLPGVGPVNRSMAGASVGAPLDAAGALHWNPASIAGLTQSEVSFGAEFLYPRTDLSSSIPFVAAGSDSSNSGVAVLPFSSIVYRPDDSPWTYGLGVATIGGFGANFPGSTTNPILTAPPPTGFGVGPAFSQLALIQFAPTAAVWVTPEVAIGFAPTFTMAGLGVDPGFFAPPDDANGDTAYTYAPATHSRYHWGLGCQVGVFVDRGGDWTYGASVKSPQWFETFQFNSRDEVGRPRRLELNIDYPLIASIGAAYRGIDRWLFATDVRYIDYQNTQGFGHAAGFAPSGAATGLGWQSIFSVATGAQWLVRDGLSLRAGYLYNENPIPAQNTFFNIVSSPIFQHAVFLGLSKQIAPPIIVSLSYLHAFDNDIQGPYLTPAGPIPGGTVRIDQVTDALTVGIHVFF